MRLVCQRPPTPRRQGKRRVGLDRVPRRQTELHCSRRLSPVDWLHGLLLPTRLTSPPCSSLPHRDKAQAIHIHTHPAQLDRMNDNCSEATTPRIASSSSSNPFSFPPQPRTSSSSSLLQDQELCIIGGGTGCNAVVGAFVGAKRITYCLPVSDDGGSSSEIQRVLGQLPRPSIPFPIPRREKNADSESERQAAQPWAISDRG